MIEEVAIVYKKEGNPNKKAKILAIRHMPENGKTVTEVSKILFRACNAIRNRRRAFRRDEIRGLEIKNTGRPARIKDRTPLEFIGAKTIDTYHGVHVCLFVD